MVVSRDRLESRITTAAGIDATAARQWVDLVVRDGRLEPMGDASGCVARRCEALRERLRNGSAGGWRRETYGNGQSDRTHRRIRYYFANRGFTSQSAPLYGDSLAKDI